MKDGQVISQTDVNSKAGKEKAKPPQPPVYRKQEPSKQPSKK